MRARAFACTPTIHSLSFIKSIPISNAKWKSPILIRSIIFEEISLFRDFRPGRRLRWSLSTTFYFSINRTTHREAETQREHRTKPTDIEFASNLLVCSGPSNRRPKSHTITTHITHAKCALHRDTKRHFVLLTWQLYPKIKWILAR